MENQTYYIFKEITDADELEQFLKLRYKVFMNSPTKHLITPNEYEIDIQEEDMQAWHLGMYRVYGGVEERVGYVRGVIEQYTEGAKWMKQILAKYPTLMNINGKSEPQPLLFYAFPHSQAAKDLLQKCRDEGGLFMKASRLFIRDDIKDRRLLAMKLSDAYIPVLIISKNVSDMGIEVADNHQQLYERMGFNTVEKTTIYGFNMSLMSVPTSEFEKNLWKKATQMHDALKETGCIHYYPHDEENFYPPFYSKMNLV